MGDTEQRKALAHKVIEDFAYALDYCDKYYGEVTKDKSKCNRETQDILHFIELEDNIDPYHAYILILKLKEIRQRRRAADDLRKVMEPYNDYFSKDRTSIINLFKLSKNVEKVEEGLIDRTYIVREREDLDFSPEIVNKKSSNKYSDDDD